MAAPVAALALLAACSKAPESGTAATDADAASHTESEAAPSFPRTPAPAGARVFFVSPKDGETVSSPVRVVFGVENIGIAPAGQVVEGAGHHHLIVDADMPDPSMPIPADTQHLHYGQGQTEATIELSPGTHTLQLVMGDHLHVPFDPVVASEKITINVQ
nr:MAG: rod shape-determining protein RodA [Pseudomonadota bacterium]